jgi:prepilin-type N-terminal cleavage/methylation domain-containing protein
MRKPTRGFTLIELMIVVAILSILATVAVPAFVKYMRRAKTVEAVDHLDKLHKSAAAYYSRGKVAAKSGDPLSCGFPTGEQMTPDINGKACCAGGALDADKDDRCDVDDVLWDTSGWSSLNFMMKDQHYFAYTFVSSGSLESAQFTARANADLDCDEILSTFERYGYGSKDASYGDCSMNSASAMYMNLDTE